MDRLRDVEQNCCCVDCILAETRLPRNENRPEKPVQIWGKRCVAGINENGCRDERTQMLLSKSRFRNCKKWAASMQ